MTLLLSIQHISLQKAKDLNQKVKHEYQTCKHISPSTGPQTTNPTVYRTQVASEKGISTSSNKSTAHLFVTDAMSVQLTMELACVWNRGLFIFLKLLWLRA